MAYFVVCRKEIGATHGAVPLVSCRSDEDWYLAEICYEHLQKAIERMRDEDENIVAFEMDDVPDFITEEQLPELEDILDAITLLDFSEVRDALAAADAPLK